MEILNLYEATTYEYSYLNNDIELNVVTTLYFYPEFITENNYYELLFDYETKAIVSDNINNTTNEYSLYSEYNQKAFIDTYYTSILDIVNSNGDLMESGADVLIPSPELTDIWSNYFDIEVGSGLNSAAFSITFYKDNDDYLSSYYIEVPVHIDTFDTYQNYYLNSRNANRYFANYWEQIYNQEFIEIGKSEGYFEGLEKGIKQGKEIGIEEGYQLGYEVGFGEGEKNRPLTTFGTVIKVISDNASSLLKTEILPNFTISNIIFIPVIFSLLGIVFKFFRR